MPAPKAQNPEMRPKQHTILVLIVVGLLASICAAENFTGKVAGSYRRLFCVRLVYFTAGCNKENGCGQEHKNARIHEG